MTEITTLRPVILAGGSGTRLQPLSSEVRPKQFLPLLDDDSPFQEALERIDIAECLLPLVIANVRLKDLVLEQADDIAFDLEDLLLEVEGKNTLAACLSAALWAQARGENYPLLICPSDHFIGDETAFSRAVIDAASAAQNGWIVTFGAVADRPVTHYGYIEVGTRLHAGYSGHKVERFVEKPDEETARNLLAQGRFVWNAGIFCVTPETLIKLAQTHCPDVLQACESAMAQNQDGVLDYDSCPSQSLDVAILEKTDQCAVVSLLTSWSDLGTWPGIWKALKLIADQSQ